MQTKIKDLEEGRSQNQNNSTTVSTVSSSTSPINEEAHANNELLTTFEKKFLENLEELQNIENRIRNLETSIIASQNRRCSQSKAEENLVTSASDSLSTAFLNNLNSERQNSIPNDFKEEKQSQIDNNKNL